MNTSSEFDNIEVRHALSKIYDRLSQIESSLSQRPESRFAREWYTVAEAASILGRAPFTVREWARLGRINALKRPSGRGKASEWMISHSEIERIQNKGLLPLGL